MSSAGVQRRAHIEPHAGPSGERRGPPRPSASRPRPPRRGRRSRELGATHPRADGPVHPSCLRRRVGRAYTFASATPHDTDVVGPPRKNAKWRKDSHVRHFLNPDDYCGSVRADGVYTHYRRRHDPLTYTEPTLAHCAWTVSTARSIVTHALLGGVSRHPRTRDSRANS